MADGNRKRKRPIVLDQPDYDTLSITTEGNCEHDRMIRCACGSYQQYWGIECFDEPSINLPAYVVKAICELDNTDGKEDEAAKMCYWHFGWRPAPNGNHCPNCAKQEQAQVTK